MGTKSQELTNGCWSKALPDEPMFILLARDPRAPELVRDWAQHRLDQVNAGERSTEDLPQIQEAFQCANRMEIWREVNDGDPPEWRKPAGPTSGELFIETAPGEWTDTGLRLDAPTPKPGYSFIDPNKPPVQLGTGEPELIVHTDKLFSFVTEAEQASKKIAMLSAHRRLTEPANIDPNRRRGQEPLHTVRREGDEWACRCGVRWTITEGNHP